MQKAGDSDSVVKGFIMQIPAASNSFASSQQMSRVMRKPMLCICENKDANQLHGNREANQYVCFRYKDSVIPLLS